MLGDRIFAAMRIDEVSECVGETEIGRPDGALRGRSEKPGWGVRARKILCQIIPKVTPTELASPKGYYT
jgi:hypothetical protein